MLGIWVFSRKPSHQWSDWLVIERGGVFDPICTSQRIGSYLIQQRYCHACGKTQIDKQATTARTGIHKPEEHEQRRRKDGVSA